MKTSFFIFLLAVCSNAYSQQVISPSNFLKPASMTSNSSEWHINPVELPDGNYLFSMTDNIPYNFVPGWYMSSAKVIKTNKNGNLLASFSVAADTFSKTTFLGLSAVVSKDEVLFIVSKDSATHNENGINKGFIVYHLDSANLQFKSADTLLDVLPQNGYLDNFFSLKSSSDALFLITRWRSMSSFYKNFAVKIVDNGQGAAVASKVSLDSVFSLNPFALFNMTMNAQWSEQADSLEIFMTVADVNNLQIFKLIKTDTSLSSFTSLDIPSYKYYYAPNKYVWATLFHQGIATQDAVILGPYLNNEIESVSGLLKYSPSTQAYEKVLLIPDSVGLSYKRKAYPFFGGIAKNKKTIFCASMDLSDPTNLYFDPVENHIYVGKTDTSLNSWDWYKYIGNPNCYHLPYKIIPRQMAAA